MRKCPTCGFNNPDSRERCLKCSTSLVTVAVPDGSAAADKPEGRPTLRIYFNRFAYWLGEKLTARVPSGLPHRYPWTAAWLSLIPGCGQLYNHQPRKALLFVAIHALLCFLFVYTIFSPSSNTFALALVFWIFYVMADGFVTATKINGDPWRFRHLVTVWFALMFMLGAVLFLAQAAGHGVIYLVTVRTDSLAPGLKRGDKLFVVTTLVYRHLPPPGSVIYYNPAPYNQDAPGGNLAGDDYVVNEQTSFEVVAARAGETISCGKDGLIRVNGVPLPPRLLPINPNGLPWEISMKVPENSVGVPMSHPVFDAGILGGLLGGSANTPRRGMLEGRRVSRVENASSARLPKKWGIEEDGEIIGVVKFCYYPPQQRRWFGGDGLWKGAPADYPEGEK